MRYNPPPNWPMPPAGWQPPSGWRPQPEWGPPPPGWQLWIDDDGAASGGAGKPTPGERARRFAGAPLWGTVATLVAVAALAVTGFSYFQSKDPGSAELEVAKVSVGDPAAIDAVFAIGKDGNGNDLTDGPGNATATPVDVTLKNNGGRQTEITTVEATVTGFQTLKDCARSGAGPVRVNAEYSIKIPLGADGPEQTDFSVPVQFAVKPGESGRMVITVGPESQSNLPRPAIVTVHLALARTDGDPLDLGDVSLATTPEIVTETLTKMQKASTDSATSTCSKSNLESIATVVPANAVQSPLIGQLKSTYEQHA